jgi:hypothetical protein
MTNFLQIFCLVSGTNCSFMKKIHRIPSKFSYVYTIHIVLIKLVLCGKWLRPQSSEPLIHTRISWQSWYPSDSYSVGLGQVQGVAYLKCFLGLGQARWLKLAILATQEVGIRRIMVPGQPWQKSSQDPIPTNVWVQWYMPVIPAMCESTDSRTVVQAGPSTK